MSLRVSIEDRRHGQERELENVKSVACRGAWLIIEYEDGSGEYIPWDRVTGVTTAPQAEGSTTRA